MSDGAGPRKLHLGCFDQVFPGWVNTDITPHIFVARVPGLAWLLYSAGMMSEQRYEQHKKGVFRAVSYLDVTKKFPYPAGWFDAVYCSHLLEHLYPDQARFCIGEIYRVLKGGGIVRIVVPDLDRIVAHYDPLQPEEFLEKMFEASQKRAKNQHHWHYNEISLARLLTDAGFRKVWRCGFKQGQCPDVALIDNRPDSLFIYGGHKVMNIHRLYRPFLRYFRTKRMQQFRRLFGLTETTRVLDVGGTLFNWLLIPNIPPLIIVNLYPPKETILPGMVWIIADARHLPFKDNAFDITYSNSVIEHLGDFASQQAFAKEIARVGVRYYVQTPNKWCPVEPHLLTPFIHYLPRSVQRRLLRHFTIWGLVTRPTVQQCDNFLREVRLLDEQELKQLFPDSEIWSERVLGLTQSLVALKI